MIESSSPVDVEEGEISSSEETTDKAASSSVKLKSRAMDRKIRLKKIHFTSKNVSSQLSTSSSGGSRRVSVVSTETPFQNSFR